MTVMTGAFGLVLTLVTIVATLAAGILLELQPAWFTTRVRRSMTWGIVPALILATLVVFVVRLVAH